MSDPTITLLRDLIAIDSVNPSLVVGGAGEGEIARMVAEEMRRIDYIRLGNTSVFEGGIV